MGYPHIHCEFIMKRNASKDYKQWKCKHFLHNFEDLTSSDILLDNGIHTVNNGDYEIDLYANNIDCVDRSLPLLVFFNGAVSNREEKIGPFFSGLNISNQLKLPSISFSDPSVDTISELNLAWYAGSSNSLDLRTRITSLIEWFHKVTERNIILLGGSGGGFAALSIIDFLKCPTLAIVWNPQTSISLYDKEAVSRYLKLALNSPADVHAYEFLSECNIVHDLCHSRKQSNNRILYLQNRTDWHLKSHTLPFAQSQGYKMIRGNGCWENNLSIYLGDFGKGHAAPSRDTIDKIINLYKEDFYSFVPDGYLSSQETDSMPFAFSIDDFHVKVTRYDTKIIIYTQVSQSYPFKSPLFAFYVLHGEKKDIQAYSKNNTLEIDTTCIESDMFQVQAFLYDDGHRCVKKIDLKA